MKVIKLSSHLYYNYDINVEVKKPSTRQENIERLEHLDTFIIAGLSTPHAILYKDYSESKVLVKDLNVNSIFTLPFGTQTFKIDSTLVVSI